MPAVLTRRTCPGGEAGADGFSSDEHDPAEVCLCALQIAWWGAVLCVISKLNWKKDQLFRTQHGGSSCAAHVAFPACTQGYRTHTSLKEEALEYT